MEGKKNSLSTWLVENKAGQIIPFLVIMPIGAYFPIIGALLIFLWLYLSKQSVSIIGLGRPKNWLKVIFLGIALGVFLKFMFKALIMPLLGAPVCNPAFQFLQGNSAAALSLGAYALASAGFCEEVVFRGYLFQRLQLWLGSTSGSRAIIVVLSSVVFGLPHLYQGWHGAVQASLVGLIFGTLFFKNRQNLWLLIIAHASFDLFAIYLIYADLELSVASLFFG